MKKIACLVADGFEEIELITIVDILRRAKVEVSLIGLNKMENISARNVKIITDEVFKKVNFDDFDGLFLPGGEKGANNLKNDKRVIDLIKKFDEEEKLISAICAAPLVLYEAGVLELTPFTCYDGLEKKIDKGLYQKDSLTVQGGHILTSRGPATASIFAFDILDYLGFEDKGKKIYKEMLFKDLLGKLE